MIIHCRAGHDTEREGAIVDAFFMECWDLDANTIPGPAAPEEEAWREEAARAGKARILLAEDDDELRTFLSWTLTHFGFDVSECRDGMELLDCLGTIMIQESGRPFDLILSDIRMQGFTGMEALELIAKEEGAPPMILITAFGDPETHAKAERLGARAVFDKPFDVNELLAYIEQVLLHPRS